MRILSTDFLTDLDCEMSTLYMTPKSFKWLRSFSCVYYSFHLCFYATLLSPPDLRTVFAEREPSDKGVHGPGLTMTGASSAQPGVVAALNPIYCDLMAPKPWTAFPSNEEAWGHCRSRTSSPWSTWTRPRWLHEIPSRETSLWAYAR